MRSLLCLIVILTATSAFAAPVLNFSDIASGPKTGNTDGVGSGAIVTIWGNNLGSTQGTSKVYIGSVEATAIYYWKDADGQLPGGPADLKTYHKMQEIAFAIPASAVDGSNIIKVTVDGTDSNTLPFTIRTGNIKFIKSGGTDSTNCGSWSSPCATMNGVMSGSTVSISAGDIWYSQVSSTSGVKVGGSASVIGTASNPISLLAYPNYRVTASGVVPGGGSSGTGAVVNNWYPSNRQNKYVNFSKISVTAAGNCSANGTDNNCVGIYPTPYSRIIGCEVTGPTVYGGYSGAIGASGNDGQLPDGAVVYGAYIHDYGYQSTTSGKNNYSYTYSDDDSTWTSPPYNGIGDACTNCTSVDRFQHLFYISCRTGTSCVPHEIGWGHFANNPILHGIHIYDQSPSGWSGTFQIHHNVVKNQRGGAIDITVPTATTNIDAYDNLIIYDSGTKLQGVPFRVLGGSSVDVFYNNTIYGWHNASYFESGGGDTVRNNIFFDTVGVAYVNAAGPPSVKSNNLFYSTGATSLPSWFSAGAGDKNVNPSFASAAGNDFSLQTGSSALLSGYNTSSIVTTDFVGLARTSSPSIGAFELSAGGSSSDTTAPVVTAASIPSTATTLAVSITTFTATDNVAVTGYLLTESATTPSASNSGWSSTAPASYTFAAAGSKTLYFWAKDAAGNISTSSTASTTITLPSGGSTSALNCSGAFSFR